MTPSERSGDLRVELYGRDDLPSPAAGRRKLVSERLSSLAAASAVDEFDVADWPKRIPCDGSSSGVRDRYLAFAAWAREAGVRLTPFFQTRECYSMETGERGDWIALPALCLAVYEDGDLAAVYPHAEGDTYHSVLAGLSSLEDDAESTGAGDSVAHTLAD